MKINKFILPVLALTTVGMASAPAMAYSNYDTNFYVAGRAGYSATSIGHMLGRSHMGDDLGSFAIAAGVQNGGLRGEIEVSTRTEFKDHGNKLDSYNLMVNLMYDIDLGYQIKPFVGAGAGLSYNKFDAPMLKDQKHTDFIFGPMAGITYDITENLTADFTYKYLIVDNFKVADGVKKDIVSNEFLLGLRYKF